MSVRKVLKLVRCNDDGRVIGEDHPRAYLTAVGEFQLIAILKNETNRKSDAGRVKSPNGYLAFSEKEIYALTRGEDYQKVNVSITVT